MCPYDCRHTFITALLSRGVPINYIAAQAGHRDPTTTLRWYSHWLPREDRSFVDALDEPVDKVGTKLGTKIDPQSFEREKTFDLIGADGQNRTGNLLITSQLLYR